MAKRLTDSELAERVRESSKVRSARRREKLSRAGRAQMLVWVPAGLKTTLETLAIERSETLSVLCTNLLSAAVGIEVATPNTTDLFSEPDNGDSPE